ncbi:Uncharacterised protein [Mycobacteroides abscessus subsp. abscessus]|nr:Uncharacterised protein [Mycobacteroides abscessus subsp. abscessus]
MPYQATAMRPRITAGRLAPRTPNAMRAVTGYGTPVCWEGRATRLHSQYTATMPTSRASSTCEAEMPSAKRLPAKT